MVARSSRWSVRWSLLLALVFVLLPPIIVQFIPTDSPEEFVFRARISESLGQSANAQLQYYRVDVTESAELPHVAVVALDRSYSRGYQPPIPINLHAWFQGGLMTPDVFYGEQYLFFGLTQVYVRQVKTGILWPDQWSGLRVLYLSPLQTIAAPLQVVALMRSDSFTYRIMAVLLARSLLLASALWFAIRARSINKHLTVVALAYAVSAVVLTIPILGHLY